MALQGTIETFALPDVLRLLGSSKKTGRLAISGSRGSGSVWVDDGKVVGADATGTPEAGPVDVLFELLRFRDGSFVFDGDDRPDEPSSPQDVEVLLTDAESRLAEWKSIEAVVPSMDVGVSLSADLPGSDVVVSADRWRVVVAIGSGTTVRGVGDALGLDEVAACRTVKSLVEQGLVEVGPAVAQPVPADTADPFEAIEHTPDAGAIAPAAEPEPPVDVGPAVLVDEPSDAPAEEPLEVPAASEAFAMDELSEPSAASSARAELDAMASGFGLEDTSSFFDPPATDGGNPPAAYDEPQPDFGLAPTAAGGDEPSTEFGGLPPASFYEDPITAPAGADPLFAEDLAAPSPGAPGDQSADPLFAPETAPAASVDTEPGDAAEVARQLANLSPKAARAVAAAARASTAEEREAALAQVTADGEEPINRGLLLKFLSSVQS